MYVIIYYFIDNKAYKTLMDYYAKLCDTVTDVGTLSHYFVSKYIIPPEVDIDICSIKVPSQQVRILLKHIMGPVKEGYFKGLNDMLDIMMSHGLQATQQIASEIKKCLNKEDDVIKKHVSYICVYDYK